MNPLFLPYQLKVNNDFLFGSNNSNETTFQESLFVLESLYYPLIDQTSIPEIKY